MIKIILSEQENHDENPVSPKAQVRKSIFFRLMRDFLKFKKYFINFYIIFEKEGLAISRLQLTPEYEGTTDSFSVFIDNGWGTESVYDFLDEYFLRKMLYGIYGKGPEAEEKILERLNDGDAHLKIAKQKGYIPKLTFAKKSIRFSETTQHNCNFLTKEKVGRYNVSMGGETDEQYTFLEFFDLDEHADICELVNKIRPLKNHKIVKTIMAGTVGIVYKLDNDHVFKLFKESHSDDLSWYEKVQRSQVLKTGTIHEPSIIDFGTVEGFNFVEMAEVIPFSNLIKFTKRNVNAIDEQLLEISSDVSYGDEDFSDIKSAAKEYHEVFKLAYKNNSLTAAEIAGYLRSLQSLLQRTKSVDYLRDAHAGNIGIMKENPNIFVVFDV